MTKIAITRLDSLLTVRFTISLQTVRAKTNAIEYCRRN